MRTEGRHWMVKMKTRLTMRPAPAHAPRGVIKTWWEGDNETALWSCLWSFLTLRKARMGACGF